jgi:hypothetical protein
MEYSLLNDGPHTRMLDREKVVAVLKRRFPGATPEQVAAAANAIVGLDDEWIELSTLFTNRNGKEPPPCGDSCYLVEASRAGASFRVFKRVEDRAHER